MSQPHFVSTCHGGSYKQYTTHTRRLDLSLTTIRKRHQPFTETSKYTSSTPLIHSPLQAPGHNSHQFKPCSSPQSSMVPLSRAEMGSFDRLPRELFEAIVLACTYSMPKHQAASLRLINKEWDAFLRPRICCTLGLDFTRLSRNSSFPPPDMGVLDNLAPFCKSLYIDLRAMRDDRMFHHVMFAYNSSS